MSAFAKDNLAEIAPQLASSHIVVQTLLVACTTFAAMAYGANRNATKSIEYTQELNHALTRERQIGRILSEVFEQSVGMSEFEFEHRLAACISHFTGAERHPSITHRALEFLSMFGLPVGRHIEVTKSLVDDYVDFLIKAGRIRMFEEPNQGKTVRRIAKSQN